MDDVLLGGSVDGLESGRKNFCSFGLLTLFDELQDFLHVSLHTGFKRLTTCVALLGLTSVFDGGFQEWHKSVL